MRKKFVALAVAGSMIAGNALADTCVKPQDDMALHTAALQQNLMVAAFSCNDAPRYNAFVLLHQGELQQSDAVLLAFFVRENGEGGMADYHTFKTKAANLSSLQSAHDPDSYCANAGRVFDAALSPYSGDLASFVRSQWNATTEFISTSCMAGNTTAEAMVAPPEMTGPPAAYEGPVPHAPIPPYETGSVD